MGEDFEAAVGDAEEDDEDEEDGRGGRREEELDEAEELAEDMLEVDEEENRPCRNAPRDDASGDFDEEL